MINLLKKPINYILTGTFTLVFAACYGAPVEMDNTVTVKTISTDGEPIKNLKVSLKNTNNESIVDNQTDDYGMTDFYELENPTSYKIYIEDIDGDANGGEFATKEIDITEETYYNVSMELKQ